MVNVNKIAKLVDAVEKKSTSKRIFLKYVSKDLNSFEKYFELVTEALKCKEADLDFFMESDPAVNSKEEIISTYPGFKAIFHYRVAHALYEADQKVAARVVSELGHYKTGIDIHPGAKIGCPFFIDHGTGTVIGETAIVGDRVKIYQGVTLGALSLSKGYKLKGTKRHPTIGSDVIIYSGASVFGGDVVIGDRCIIGSGVQLTESLPSDRKVYLAEQALAIIERKR